MIFDRKKYFENLYGFSNIETFNVIDNFYRYFVFEILEETKI